MTSRNSHRVQKSTGRRVLGVLSWLTVLALLAGAVAGGVVLHERGSLNDFLCGGDCGDQYVAVPEALEVLEPGDQTVSGLPPASADVAVPTGSDDSTGSAGAVVSMVSEWSTAPGTP